MDLTKVTEWTEVLTDYFREFKIEDIRVKLYQSQGIYRENLKVFKETLDMAGEGVRQSHYRSLISKVPLL